MTEKYRLRWWPNLTEGTFRESSKYDARYNCIALAAGNNKKWWEPLGYWPFDNSENSVEGWARAFETLGYQRCGLDHSLDELYEKVAIYATPNGEATHMARQLSDGRWLSKLGRNVDIEHINLDVLNNRLNYGQTVLILRRRKKN